MAKNTKIILLAPYNVYPARTGGKKFIALFYEYLSRILPVSFVSVPANEMPAEYKASFYGVLGNSKLRYANPFLFFRLKKIIKKEQITDLIIVHPYFGWLAWMLKKTTGINLSLLSHNIESVRFKSMGKSWWKMMWAYEKKVHRIIDHNFFVTREDRIFAIKNYKLDPAKCHVITYGIESEQPPAQDERVAAGKLLRQLYQIDVAEKILLFNGSLDYLPNIEAMEHIVNNINPELLRHPDFKYKIIICGKGLPAKFKAFRDDPNIIHAGFVDDINVMFKGADLFLNPVISGGGIKTKLVEALGNGLSAVSSINGAFGVSKNITGGKLEVIADNEWDKFAAAIIATDSAKPTPPGFFNHFYWGNIAGKAGDIITTNNLDK